MLRRFWARQRRRFADEGGWIIAGFIVSALATAYATYSQAQSTSQAADYNRKVAKNNAIGAKNAAEVEIENRKNHYAHLMASQRAGIGASGVQASEGSPLLVQMDAAAEAKLDEARVRYQGEVGSRNYQSEAQLQKFYARTAQTQGYIGAGASLLQGATKVGGRMSTQQPERLA